MNYPAQRELLLLVDDEPVVRRLAQRILSGNGYRVLVADSGDEALTLITADKERRIGMLITDIMMPGMNGIELAAVAERVRPGLKVIFISGNGQTGMPILKKPFTTEELLGIVREMLDGLPPAARY